VELGDMLRKFRLQRNLTLAELSEKSGVSISFISQVENGKNMPSLETLKALAKALHITIEVLVLTNSISPEEEQEFLLQLKNDPEMKDIWDQIKDMPPQQKAEVARIIRLWKAQNKL
jgi:transcriptional regulator with XRE-family HTH domain